MRGLSYRNDFVHKYIMAQERKLIYRFFKRIMGKYNSSSEFNTRILNFLNN